MEKVKIVKQEVLDNRKVIMQTIEETLKNGHQFTSKKIVLPYLANNELLARYRRIEPIVSINDVYYYLKRHTLDELRWTSYIRVLQGNIRKQVDMTDAESIGEFSCYHTFGYFGLFIPSIAEVLQQFPDDLLDDANAFCMINYPETSDDLAEQAEIVNAGCHKSTVRALILKK